MNNPSAMAAIRQQQILHQQQQRQMMAQQFPGMTPGAVNGMPMGMQLTPQQLHQLRQARNAAQLGHVNVSSCFIWRFLHRDREARDSY